MLFRSVSASNPAKKRDDQIRLLCWELFLVVKHLRKEYHHGHGFLMDPIEEQHPSRWLLPGGDQQDKVVKREESPGLKPTRSTDQGQIAGQDTAASIATAEKTPDNVTAKFEGADIKKEDEADQYRGFSPESGANEDDRAGSPSNGDDSPKGPRGKGSKHKGDEHKHHDEAAPQGKKPEQREAVPESGVYFRGFTEDESSSEEEDTDETPAPTTYFHGFTGTQNSGQDEKTDQKQPEKRTLDLYEIYRLSEVGKTSKIGRAHV